MFRSRTISLALVGLFVWVTACASYKQIEPAEVADYDEVRVTFSDGEQLVSKDVTVEGDSIFYWRKTEPPAQYDAARVASPLEQVVEVEAAGAGTAGTVLTVFGVLVGTVIVIWAIACTAETEPQMGCAW